MIWQYDYLHNTTWRQVSQALIELERLRLDFVIVHSGREMA